MEALVRERRPLRKLFSKYEKDVQKLMEAEERDVTKIKVTFGMVAQTFEKLSSVDQKFIDFIQANEVDPEAENNEYQGQGEFRLRLEMLRENVDKVIAPPRAASVVTDPVGDMTPSSFGDGRFRNYTLPQVKIPTFTGQLKDWLGYWAKFEPIHEDKFMSGSDKFTYLLQTLQPGSEPHKIVSRFPQNNENYKLAVEGLQKKYANPDILLEVYIRELLGLIVSNFTARKKLPLKDLFLSLDAQIRAMRTLNMEQADPSIWLFPLVEACLPGHVLKQWKRRQPGNDDETENRKKNRIDSLLEFMEKEVELDDDVSRTEKFTEKTCGNRHQQSLKRSSGGHPRPTIPTMAGFHVAEVKKVPCLFCRLSNHESYDCLKAKRMDIMEKKGILKSQFRCFKCFEHHHARTCNNQHVKCQLCGGRHYSVMCEPRPFKKEWAPPPKRTKTSNTVTTTLSSSNQMCSTRVILQTIRLKVGSERGEKNVRCFLDNGSQRSYILTQTADELKLEPMSVERVVHSLFGGATTKPASHQVFEIRMRSLDDNYSVKVNLRDQRQICGKIPSVQDSYPAVAAELEKLNIILCDYGGDDCPIEVLIGADLYGKIITGEKLDLDNGLTAIETRFGWTVMGEIDETQDSTALYMNMMVSDATIAQLWELERIGVEGPEERHGAEETQRIVKEKFVQKMTRNEDGRYRVGLPWKEGHPLLPSNKDVALKRLKYTVEKLKKTGLLMEYGRLFTDWETEGFIEKVRDPSTPGHYVPHRPVIKRESETTPVRPVFDASCKSAINVSLNDCLEKGPNLIQLIPSVITRFRMKKVAFVADIRKAFQMVEITEADRDFMRFLWCQDGDLSQPVEYRHARVMFGATSSPFILGAVLEHYLKSLPEVQQKIGTDLWERFYVDNCVASVDCQADYLDFKQNAVELLKDIRMDLRMWYSNVDINLNENTLLPVLGLLWNRKSDTLALKLDKFTVPNVVTKKTVLSSIARIFDPIGFSSPALIPLKKLLQKSWIERLGWNDKLPEAEEKLFLEWIEEIDFLKEIEIPRLASAGERDSERWSMQVFADASASAYAAVMFLRVETETKVELNLISAKARVSPLKKMTIPRLELLSCLLAARLSVTMKKALKLEDVEETLWSDSTTALAWIRRMEPWATWVGNRVTEIRQVTKVENWRHVPGSMNPADLPSRGCSPKQLLKSKWWLGPDWLKQKKSEWPAASIGTNEEIIFSERRRVEIPMELTAMTDFDVSERFSRELNFDAKVRILGWIGRFIFNSRRGTAEKRQGELSDDEIKDAKKTMWKLIQSEYFPNPKCESMKKLEVITDENGILRVKTRLTFRNDDYNFKFPILLHGKSPLVKQLISELHRHNHHAGVGFLMSTLRESFWIVKARQVIGNVISKCFRCKRFTAKAIVTPTAPLPLDRMQDAEVFQTVGVDLAGPLHLKNGKKAWLVIFTCAVYRAVYFTVVGSLSTVAFIGALRKFIEKYRRPDVIYCDNGTNFHGAANLFKKLDWKTIQQESAVNPIVFKFSPPISAWYGGWWERLIGTAKEMLKRSVGKSTLNRAELELVIGEISNVMNQRPLTYVSEDPEDLEPLTPAHFLNPLGKVTFPEGELTEAEKLRVRLNVVRKLKQELRSRFRKEYLAYLVSRIPKKESRRLKVGELVLVGNDNKKRLMWPLARVVQIFPGKDGVGRVAKVKTGDGELTRTVQGLFPLELDIEDEKTKNELEKVFKTRAGRLVRKPSRFGFSN